MSYILDALKRSEQDRKQGEVPGIISFQSGEDCLVKRAFLAGRESGAYEAISGGAITPRDAEVRANWRSASATFRWARKA